MIPLGQRAVLRTAVPPTAVNEDCYPSLAENDICLTPTVGEWALVDPIAQTTAVQLGTKR